MTVLLLLVALVPNILLISSATDDQCNANERYVKCPALVQGPKSCSQLGFPQPQINPGPEGKCPGRPGCLCIDGYLRNDKGVCVPKKNCRECGGDPNAVAGCGKYCNTKCSDIGGPQRACTKECKVNACDCKSGYYLDEKTKRCVLPKKCTLQCNGPNEYYACGGACDNVCATLSQQNQTSCPIVNIKCNDMCYCDDGYARDNNNVCVPYDKCPQKTSCNGDPNAHSGCGENCGRTCGTYKKANNNGVVKCHGMCKEDGCDCNDGYVLDEVTGKCVLPENCTLQCNGPNEYYACSGACDNVCATLSQQNQTSCPIVNIKCNDMCYCDDGYARDNNKVCVPYDKCPPPPTCKGDVNAHDGCGNHCGRSCATYKDAAVILCSDVCYTNACDCNDGYVFDDVTKKCVLPDDCTPTCKGDPNAKPGCGVNCGRTCDTYDKKPGSYACIQSCNSEGCDCIDGYVFDGNTGQCVLPKKCSKNGAENI